MKKYPELFLTFAKIGVCTFGGGMAMLPILQREVVTGKGWATDSELTDYFAIGQCTPGVIAVNTATFIGRKRAGVPGALVATLGLIFPSILIIGLIAVFLRQFAEIQWVAHAFAGIRACVCALILRSVWTLGRSAIVDPPAAVLFAAVLIGSAFLGLSPVLFVLLGGVCGLSLSLLRRRGK